LLAQGGNRDKASAIWDQVANDMSVDPLLRDFTNLSWASNHLDSPEAAANRLKPLLNPTNPWHVLASEVDAWIALERGAKADAEAKLRTLAQDVSAPQGVRNRAQALLGQLAQ
jgi:hypothetical protein